MVAALLLDLPCTDYRKVLSLQHAAVEARKSGRLSRDLVIMVEHQPVFTIGRRRNESNLLVSHEWLAEKKIEVVSIERGGDITFHGPGQVVIYPIVALNQASISLTEYVDVLERCMVKTAADWRVPAHGDPSRRGAWVGPRKIGSIGISMHCGISFHGLAFNVNIDLTPFDWINPCGLPECQMTSIAKESGKKIEVEEVRRQMRSNLGQLLNMDFQLANASVLLDEYALPVP